MTDDQSAPNAGQYAQGSFIAQADRGGTAQVVVHQYPAFDPAATRAQRNRRRMLMKVRSAWITGVLEPSVHRLGLLNLSFQELPQAVLAPADHVLPDDQQTLDSALMPVSIVDVFDAFAGELLILGEPGAGKTTLLLELTRALLDRADQDASTFIPVVFNLSSWAATRPPLGAWLIEELSLRYDVSRALGTAWVEHEQILPLLDGLDEVAAEYRAACVEAINAFRAAHGLVPLVVCSRRAEYEGLKAARLRLRGAVLVQPLTPAAIDQYLTRGGEALLGLRVALERDAALRELAASPLMLSIMVSVYRDTPADQITATGSVDEGHRRLLEQYVKQMLTRQRPSFWYTGEATSRWLTWLAHEMTRRSLTVFHIERLQPDWLPTTSGRRRYELLARLLIGPGLGLAVWLVTLQVSALVLALSFLLVSALGGGPAALLRIDLASPRLSDLTSGLFTALVAGLVAGLVFGLIDLARPSLLSQGVTAGGTHDRQSGTGQHRFWLGLTGALTGGLTGALVFGLIFSLFGGLHTLVFGGMLGALTGGTVGGLASRLSTMRSIEIVEAINWSTGRAVRHLRQEWQSTLHFSLGVGLGVGLVFALITGLFAGLYRGSVSGLVRGLVPGLVVGLVVGVIFGLVDVARGGLIGRVVGTRAAPNQGIWRTGRNGLGLGLAGTLAGGLAGALLFGLVFRLITGVDLGVVGALAGGLGIGLVIGLDNGGETFLRHFVLRFVLWQHKCLPWFYARFLDETCERVLLRRVGSGYIFIHRLVLEHFATLPLEVDDQPSPSPIPTRSRPA